MKIGVIGAGAWGTALAQVAAHGGRPVRLWARDPAVAEAINTTHANPLYLPNIVLSPSIEAVSDPAAMAEMDALLVVTPAQAVGAVLATMPVGPKGPGGRLRRLGSRVRRLCDGMARYFEGLVAGEQGAGSGERPAPRPPLPVPPT